MEGKHKKMAYSDNNESVQITDSSTDSYKMTKKKVIEEILSWVIILALAFILAELITTFVVMRAEIISESMVPELLKDDHVIGSRLAYSVGEPHRGDVVFFEYPKSNYMLGVRDKAMSVYVKRIIGLPGEKVEIRKGKIYINDAPIPLDEPYTNGEPDKRDFGPYYVPEDSYFMLGDNRNISVDSRFWVNPDQDSKENPDKYRFVKRENIYAKAWIRYIRDGSLSVSLINHHEYTYDYYGSDMLEHDD